MWGEQAVPTDMKTCVSKRSCKSALGSPIQLKAQKHTIGNLSQLCSGGWLLFSCWSIIFITTRQRLGNHTQDAIKVIPEQLNPISKMVWENKFMLDMIWAEKDRVSVILGGQSCPSFTVNRTPDMTITRKLKRRQCKSWSLVFIFGGPVIVSAKSLTLPQRRMKEVCQNLHQSQSI